jgi:triosephosphate isomerase
MRKPIVAGNWKMNKTVAEARELVAAMVGELGGVTQADVVFCPPFMAVPDVARAVAGTNIGVGAQDMYWEKSGAYTGEVSPAMVAEFCQYVIIGHSERREHFGETDESVNKKIKAALAIGLKPIVCIGESLALRQANQTEPWIEGQVRGALNGLTAEQVSGLILAYEPIWAIGTGWRPPPPRPSASAGRWCAPPCGRFYGAAVAEAVRVQYGGSVSAANAAELFAQPNIDGGLVGGASLKAADFITIVKAAIK